MFILSSLMPYLVISCLVSIETHVAGDMMLLANFKSDSDGNGSLYVSNIVTNDQQIMQLDFIPIPLASVRNPIAVDYDANEELMYWVDFTVGSISRAYLNGSQQQVVVSGLQAPTGLTFDPMSLKIYFTEEGRQRIGVVNHNGTNLQIIVDNLQHKPRPIIVHHNSRSIYWAEWDDSKQGHGSLIQRADLDGSHVTPIIQSDLQEPNGLAIHYDSLYWCDSGSNRIEKSSLTGHHRQVLFSTDNDIHPFDVAIYKDHIYWSEWSQDLLSGVHMSNKQRDVSRQVHMARPAAFCMASGIAIYIDDIPPAALCPDNITRTTDINSNGTSVAFQHPTATDNSGNAILHHQMHHSGQFFPIGTTVVTYTFKDLSNNMASCSFNITVLQVDNTPPVPHCPHNITTLSPTGMAVHFHDATVTDNSGSPVITVNQTHTSGQVFPPGTTIVTYTFMDHAGNIAQCSFTITIVEATMATPNLLANQRMKQVHSVVTISVWTVLAASVFAVSLLIIIFTLMYRKICCSSKLKSIYESSLLGPEDTFQYVMYQTVAEKKTDDYATTLDMKTQNDAIHNLDNPGYLTKDGIAGLQPQYTNLLPKEENHQLLGVEPPSQVAFIELNQPPNPPSVNKLNTLVQMQKTI